MEPSTLLQTGSADDSTRLRNRSGMSPSSAALLWFAPVARF
jgi:hypothetical protein